MTKRPIILMALCIILLCCLLSGCSSPTGALSGDLGWYLVKHDNLVYIDPLDAEKTSYRDYYGLILRQAIQKNNMCALQIIKKYPRPFAKPYPPSDLEYFKLIARKNPRLGNEIFQSLVAYGAQQPEFKITFSMEKDIYRSFMYFAYPYILKRFPEFSPSPNKVQIWNN